MPRPLLGKALAKELRRLGAPQQAFETRLLLLLLLYKHSLFRGCLGRDHAVLEPLFGVLAGGVLGTGEPLWGLLVKLSRRPFEKAPEAPLDPLHVLVFGNAFGACTPPFFRPALNPGGQALELSNTARCELSKGSAKGRRLHTELPSEPSKEFLLGALLGVAQMGVQQAFLLAVQLVFRERLLRNSPTHWGRKSPSNRLLFGGFHPPSPLPVLGPSLSRRRSERGADLP